MGDWLNKHGDDRESVWYWEYRFLRDYHRFERTVELEPPQQRLSDHDLAAFRKPLLAELERLEPLTEAKILLLMNADRDDRRLGDDIDPRIFGPPWQTRLTKDEILDLLGGESLWSELNLVVENETLAEMNSRLVTRLMFDSTKTFSAEDVPQLQQLLDSTKLKMSVDGIAAWHVGISKLLPAATPDTLDDQNTLDGYLRKEIHENGSNRVAASLAAELTQVGLPANATWLRELFFANQKDGIQRNYLQITILESQSRKSGPGDERTLLWSLVTDDRFRPIWTFASSPRKGKSLDDHPTRLAAFRAINANAGETLVDWPELKKLSDPTTSQNELESLLRKLRAFQPAEQQPVNDRSCFFQHEKKTSEELKTPNKTSVAAFCREWSRCKAERRDDKCRRRAMTQQIGGYRRKPPGRNSGRIPCSRSHTLMPCTGRRSGFFL